jgi:DNA-binding winged helix-turn-helix (wHTH) protein
LLNGLFWVNLASLVRILGERLWGSPSELSKKMKSSEWAYANRIPMSSLYRFGQFVLDPAMRTLSRADSPVFLNPRAMDVLIFLAQNPNRLVTKEELLDAVWRDAFVEEGNLTQSISHLRKALGDNSEDTRLIVTIPRKGYQFAGDVTAGEAAATAKQAAVQVSRAESSQADTLPRIEGQIREQEPRVPKYWRKAAVMGASVVILVVVGYMSWRHFRDVTPAGSKKNQARRTAVCESHWRSQ